MNLDFKPLIAKRRQRFEELEGVITDPSLFDDANKALALPLLERSKIESLPAGEKMRVNEELAKIGRLFKFDGQSQVELRFSELNYKLIWQLQTDELVDRQLTPQTKASIRIVLGKVESFANAGKLQ